MSDDKFNIFIGRMNPLHLGHINIIKTMLNDSNRDNYMIGIGSCNEPISIKNIFDFSQRLYMLQLADIPMYNVVGIPDYPQQDKLWFKNIRQLVTFKGGNPNNIVFYAGSYTDASYAIDFGYSVKIVDRYTGVKFSSSEIKDRLIRGDHIIDFVHENCIEYIAHEFNNTWNKRYSNFK